MKFKKSQNCYCLVFTNLSFFFFFYDGSFVYEFVFQFLHESKVLKKKMERTNLEELALFLKDRKMGAVKAIDLLLSSHIKLQEKIWDLEKLNKPQMESFQESLNKNKKIPPPLNHWKKR